MLLVAAALIFFRIRSPTWGSPPQYLFDECYTAFAANRMASGDPVIFERAARRFEYLRGGQTDLGAASRGEWSHPPGAPLVMSCFVWLFGFSDLAVRAVAAFAALATLAALASFAGRQRAWCVCALLALDGSFFVFARTAMPHMLMVAGLTVGIAALERAFRSKRPTLCAALAGASFGLAFSVRWTALPVGVAVSAVACVMAFRARRWGAIRPALAGAGAALVTYIATYAPFFAHGHSFGDLVVLHRQMMWFHAHLPAHFGQGTPWYTWPWQLHGVVFTIRELPSGTVSVLSVGGPLLGLAFVPTTLRAAWLAVTRGGIARTLGVTAIGAVWLPWAVLNRFGLAYYLLPALPFAAVFVVDFVVSLRKKWAMPAYLGAAAIVFVALYPVLAAVSLPSRAARAYFDVLL